MRSRLRRGLEALRRLLGPELGHTAAALSHSSVTLAHWEANLPLLEPGEVEPESDEPRLPDE